MMAGWIEDYNKKGEMLFKCNESRKYPVIRSQLPMNR